MKIDWKINWRNVAFAADRGTKRRRAEDESLETEAKLDRERIAAAALLFCLPAAVESAIVEGDPLVHLWTWDKNDKDSEAAACYLAEELERQGLKFIHLKDGADNSLSVAVVDVLAQAQEQLQRSVS